MNATTDFWKLPKGERRALRNTLKHLVMRRDHLIDEVNRARSIIRFNEPIIEEHQEEINKLRKIVK